MANVFSNSDIFSTPIWKCAGSLKKNTVQKRTLILKCWDLEYKTAGSLFSVPILQNNGLFCQTTNRTPIQYLTQFFLFHYIYITNFVLSHIILLPGPESYFTGNLFPTTVYAMVVILDGNSEHGAHARRKIVFFVRKNQIFDCSRSNQTP